MSHSPFSISDIAPYLREMIGYRNVTISDANDHVVKLSIMTEPFYCHIHPNSDETFLGVEGIICIDLEDQAVELGPGQLFTVPAQCRHRTRPKGDRSVNLTFEKLDMITVPV